MLTITHMTDLATARRITLQEEQEWTGARLSELAPEFAVAAKVNGALIAKMDTEQWERIPPDGSTILFITTEDGKFGGIIVGVILIIIGAALLLTGVGGQIGAYLIVAGISSIVGGVVSLLLPTPQLRRPGGNGSSDSPSYGFDGPVTTVEPGRPKPFIHGKLNVGGQVIQSETIVKTLQLDGIRALYSLGHGPIESIAGIDSAACIAAGGDANGCTLEGEDIPDGILIGGIELNTLNGAKLHIRLGNLEQTIIPGYEDVVQQFDLEGKELRHDTEVWWETRTPITAAEFILSYPQGVWHMSTDGEVEKLDKPPRAKVWCYELDGTTLVDSKDITTDEEIRQPLKNSLRFDNLPIGKYKFKAKYDRGGKPRYLTSDRSGDMTILSNIKEICYNAPAYVGMALVGIEVDAGPQLSGRIQRVVIPVKGRKVRTLVDGAWTVGETYTTNPAYVAADVITSDRYGMGALYTINDLPIADWQAYADWCDEEIGAYNGAGTGNTGAIVKDYANQSVAVINPQPSGDYTGTAVGRIDLELLSLVTDTSATFRRTLTQLNGNDPPDVADFVFTSVGPVDIGFGLEITLALDPNTSTTGWHVGDKWRFSLQPAVLQKRFEYNGTMDIIRAGPEAVALIGLMSRAQFLQASNKAWIPVLEKQKPHVDMFTPGNVLKGTSPEKVFDNIIDKASVIEVGYIDAEQGYSRAVVTAAIPGVDENDGRLIREVIDLIGVTDKYQARRAAFYALRARRRMNRTLTFAVGVEGMATLPGDPILWADNLVDWAIGGRVAGISIDGWITMDQEFPFEAGKIYVYIERDPSDPSNTRSVQFEATGSTAVLPIVPLDERDPTGWLFAMGEIQRAQNKWTVMNVLRGNGMRNARFVCMNYDATVLTDEAEPMSTAQYYAPPGAAPPDVTNLELEETSTNEGESRIEVDWDSAAGAKSYQVWAMIGGDTTAPNYTLAGTTSGTSLTFKTSAPMGVPVSVRVVTVMPDGRRTILLAAPEASLFIARIDDDDVIVHFPATVENPVFVDLAHADGNRYRLEWDEVDTEYITGDSLSISGYEVRINGWGGGITVYSGSSEQTGTLRLPPIAMEFHVRAYKTYGGRRWYSPEDVIIFSPAAEHVDYPTPELAETAYNFATEGAVQNGTPIAWGFDNELIALLQLVATAPLEYLSPTYDVGSVLDLQFGVAAQLSAWWTNTGASIYAGALHESGEGDINRRYFSYSLDIEFSPDGSEWDNIHWAEDPNKNHTATARYVRLRLRAVAINPYPELDDNDAFDPAVAPPLIERLALAIQTT